MAKLPVSTLRTLTGLRLPFLALPALLALALSGCEDEVSGIGNTLVSDEVIISVDSTDFDLKGRSVYHKDFDSRGTVNLIGSLHAPEYGTLDCSYVARLLPVTTLNIPDSISESHLDSLRIEITVPRGALAGDSLAPQQLRIYPLIKQIPNDVSSGFNPEGYYDSAKPFGSRSYTLSVLGASDSLYREQQNITIPVKLPYEMALETFKAYKKGSSAFEWPSTFAKYFPGIYVEPSFGMGAVADVSATKFVMYFHYDTTVTTTDKDGKVTNTLKRNTAGLPIFTTAAEVLNSNNISYTPSALLDNLAADGKAILTSPGGYTVDVTLPMHSILQEYKKHSPNLSVINNLLLSIPAKEIENDYGITPPPYLLLVRKDKAADFFRNLSLPDGKTSFYAAYDADKKAYTFSSLREYVVTLSEQESISAQDCEFEIIPVSIATETYTDYYDGYKTKTAVVRCDEYFLLPSMCELDTSKGSVIFTFSAQTVK